MIWPRAAGRGAARLDAGADVDAVRFAGAARDRHGAVAGRDRHRRAAGAPLQGLRARDGRHPRAADPARVSRRPLRGRAGAPRRRARLAPPLSHGPDARRRAPAAPTPFCFAGARASVVRVAAARPVAAGAGRAFFCRSSWPCCSSPATTRRHSSSTPCSACCSPRPSWPRSPPRRSQSSGVRRVAVHATRPLTSAALVAAKLSATVWSTLAAWLLVLVAIPLALTLSGTWPVVIERARRLTEVVGMPRAVVIVLLGVPGIGGVDVEAARAESVHRPDRPRHGSSRGACSSPCRSSSSSGRSPSGSATTTTCRGRCGTRCPRSSRFWSASRCSPPPGSPRGSIAAGC